MFSSDLDIIFWKVGKISVKSKLKENYTDKEFITFSDSRPKLWYMQCTFPWKHMHLKKQLSFLELTELAKKISFQTSI